MVKHHTNRETVNTFKNTALFAQDFSSFDYDIQRPVHTILFEVSDFCWFRNSAGVNTVKMTFRHTDS